MQLTVLWLLSAAPLDRTERKSESEIGSKCNKGAVNRLELRVKKENKKWPTRRDETEGIQKTEEM